MALIFRSQALSELGLVRKENEDSALLSPALIAVADGMGGHVGGEIASKIAIETAAALAKLLVANTFDAESKEDLLMNLPLSVDAELGRYLSKHPSASGMGTTFTALALSEGERALQVIHVGDSRAYRWSKDRLTPLTVDHTVVQELIGAGRITPEEALSHPSRSLLTQALMGQSQLDPMLVSVGVAPGERFLICSDGLSAVLSDFELNQIIREQIAKQADVVKALSKEVHRKGAPDNLTIIWAEVTEADFPTTKSGALGKRELKMLGAAK